MLLINGKVSEKPLPKLKKRATFTLGDQYFRNEVVGDRNGNSRRVRRAPASVSFDPFYVYTDESGNIVELRYCNRLPQVDGQRTIYSPYKIDIENGMVQVGPESPDLYYFLVNHPDFEKADGSNAGRSKFKLLDEKVKSERKVEKERLVFEAKSLIIGPTALKEHEQRRLLMSFDDFNGDVDSLDFATVRDVLLSYADNEPEKMCSNARSSKTEIKIVVQENINLGKIFYDEGTRHWRWKKDKKGNAASICVVPAGKDKQEWFIDWLIADTSNVLEELKKVAELAREEKEIAAMK
jgi:hypothetical protein